MSNNKMLIDATHPEETRVVVLRDGRVEEFDYESAARKPLRGNIYLAKVTRVEPSLQAAFVEYGGNRHGFLAFNEIHPDYYQIPVADRQALIEEEAAAEAAEEAEADARAERRSEGRRRDRRRDRGGEDFSARGYDEAAEPQEPDYAPERDDGSFADTRSEHASARDDAVEHPAQTSAEGLQDERRSEEPPAAEIADHQGEHVGEAADEEPPQAAASDVVGEETAEPSDVPAPVGLVEDVGVHEVENGSGNGEAETIEEVGASEDAMEEVPVRPRRRARSYKIQEVIKRRQVILVQVVKEERGNKGAALTTYLSLAGRYTVLMPNTARGGGISRKITQPQDRKRLKAIAAELDVPDGMGLIIRTAGAARTKQEIKRDFEYLLRLWENVREMTLQSSAPTLVYEEGDLIKRSIRDHYSKDVDEILVAGDAAFHEARDFMGMLMPSHAKNVIEYTAPEPLFTRFQIERQLNAMFSPYVTLRSGGYLVVNQTEALVAIDVNSGKSTREFSIEETALNTNLEAADEIARQLKLRDLAGLIVIDFIDMEEKRNNRAVERRLKDALRFDRARIQVGRISHFGLLEMSRQRLRTGVLEGSTSQCPHCQGTGMIRSTESVALAVLRGLEDALISGPRHSLVALTTSQVALYILNNKRAFINDMEKRSGVAITVQASDKMQGANFSIERGAAPVLAVRRPERTAVNMDWGFSAASDNEPPEEGGEGYREHEDVEEVGGEPRDEREARDDREEREDREGDRRGRRRRRRRGRRGEGEGVRAERAPADADEDVGEASSRDEPREGEGEDATGDDIEPAGDEGIEAAEGDGNAQDGRGEGERGDDDRRGRRRRRGRRGGRRGGRDRMTDEGGAPLGSDEASPEPAGGTQADYAAPIAAAPIAGQGEQPDVELYAVLPEHHPVEGETARPERGGRFRSRRRDRAEGEARPRVVSERADAAAQSGEPAALEAGAAAPAPIADAPAIDAEPARAAPAEAVVSGSEPPAHETTEPAAAAPAAAMPDTAPARPRRSNGDPQAITPRIERVVVKPDEAGAAPVEETAPATARKGWWSRKLGM